MIARLPGNNAESNLGRGPAPTVGPEGSPPWQPIAAQGLAASATTGKRILVVDDNLAFRLLATMALSSRGYDCREAEDGRAALAYLSTNHVDLVLTDRWMPNMGGLELIRCMSANPALRTIPAVLFTSDLTEEVRVAALQAGASAVVSKLVSVERLIDGIGRVLRAPPQPSHCVSKL